MEKQDWILDNIKSIIRAKGIKLTAIAKELGKSQGEISKILNGERENYTDDLHKWVKPLGTPFHDLVQNNSLSQYVHEVKDNGVGNVHTYQKLESSIYEERIRDKDELIKSEREQKEYWKTKYYKLKDKLILLEDKLSKTSKS